MTTTPDAPLPGPDAAADDARLEAAFAALRAARPRPGGALVARVLADAEAAGPPPSARAAGLSRLLFALYRSLGGAPAAAGLGIAALAGVWIGASPPELFDGVAAAVWAAPGTLDFGPFFLEGALDGLDLSVVD
jgi:hypothetical protein